MNKQDSISSSSNADKQKDDFRKWLFEKKTWFKNKIIY